MKIRSMFDRPSISPKNQSKLTVDMDSYQKKNQSIVDVDRRSQPLCARTTLASSDYASYHDFLSRAWHAGEGELTVLAE